jgi:hypothetical protein
MSKINTFSGQNLELLRRKLNDALAQVTAETGVSFDVGSISYGAKTATTKLSMTAIGDAVDNDSSTQEIARKVEFEAKASKFGLKKSDFGRTFNFNGTDYLITGINPKARKNAIIGRQADNPDATEYVFPTFAVARALEASAA